MEETPSTWLADDRLAPKLSRWIDNKGRLFIIIRAIYNFELNGCKTIHLLNVEQETSQEIEFSEFKTYVQNRQLIRKF